MEVRILGIKVFEKRNSLGTALNPTEALIAALGGTATDAGVPVTVQNVTTISAVWRAINVISGTLAGLPLKVYRRDNQGNRNQEPTNKLQLLIENPSALMTDFIFRETMQAHLLIHGNAYAQILRDDSGRPTELELLQPDDVTIYVKNRRLLYDIKKSTGTERVVQSDMIHIPGLGFDGVKGKGIISIARESFSLTLAAQKFGARFFGNGANMDGVLEVPGTLNDDTFKRLRESWKNKYSGASQSHETAILEGGMKYTRISIPPEDAQFLETRQFQVAEIARWFEVPPHLLMDLERATNNNIEHQSMEFVQYTLQKWISRWEAELNRKLITNGDRGKLFFEYNLNGLLRGDSKSRSEYYRSMYAISAMTANEIRKLENQPPYEGGDQHFTQAGNMPVEIIKDYYLNKTTKKNEPAQ